MEDNGPLRLNHAKSSTTKRTNITFPAMNGPFRTGIMPGKLELNITALQKARLFGWPCLTILSESHTANHCIHAVPCGYKPHSSPILAVRYNQLRLFRQLRLFLCSFLLFRLPWFMTNHNHKSCLLYMICFTLYSQKFIYSMPVTVCCIH